METGTEVFQIGARHGERWEMGRGSNWNEAAKNLMDKIYDLPGLSFK